MKLTWTGKSQRNKTQIGHIYYWKENYTIAAKGHYDTDTIWYKKQTQETNFTIHICEETGRKTPKPSQINVYTDGSKTVQGTGAGYVIFYKKQLLHTESINLPKNASIFQAEIFAIYKAALYLSLIHI